VVLTCWGACSTADAGRWRRPHGLLRQAMSVLVLLPQLTLPAVGSLVLPGCCFAAPCQPGAAHRGEGAGAGRWGAAAV